MITMNRLLIFIFQVAIIYAVFVRSVNTKFPSFDIQLDLDEANKKEPVPFKSASAPVTQFYEEIKKEPELLKPVPTPVTQPDEEPEKEPKLLKPVPTPVTQPDEEPEKEPELLKPVLTPVTQLNETPPKTPIPLKTAPTPDTQPKEKPVPSKPVSASVSGTRSNKKNKKEPLAQDFKPLNTNVKETKLYCYAMCLDDAEDTETGPGTDEQCLPDEEDENERVVGIRAVVTEFMNNLVTLVDDALQKEKLLENVAEIQYAA